MGTRGPTVHRVMVRWWSRLPQDPWPGSREWSFPRKVSIRQGDVRCPHGRLGGAVAGVEQQSPPRTHGAQAWVQWRKCSPEKSRSARVCVELWPPAVPPRGRQAAPRQGWSTTSPQDPWRPGVGPVAQVFPRKGSIQLWLWPGAVPPAAARWRCGRARRRPRGPPWTPRSSGGTLKIFREKNSSRRRRPTGARAVSLRPPRWRCGRARRRPRGPPWTPVAL